MTTQRQLLEPIRLEFSNNSVRRTTAQVDSLGIFYSVSREDDGIINVRRWDQPTNTEILVGQINFKWFTPSLVRVGEGTQWVNIRDFLRREHGRWYSPFVSSLPITISYFSSLMLRVAHGLSRVVMGRTTAGVCHGPSLWSVDFPLQRMIAT